MRRIIAAVCFMVLPVLAGAKNVYDPDSSLSLVDKAKVQAWMSDARHKMFERDWRGALGLYREVLIIDPANGKAEFRSAECHYHLYSYDFALEHLALAEKLEGTGVDKEFYYVQGLIYHKLQKFDDAIASFEKFKTVLKNAESKDEEFQITKMIAESRFAKEAIANPIPIRMLNFNSEINTRYREYGAVVTNDGQHMYFTSRRQDSKGGALAGDGVFYEDIYVSKWDQAEGKWVDAEHAPGRVNEDQHEGISHIYEDPEDGDLTMYLTVNATGGTQSSDIAYSRLSEKGTWSKPRYLPKKKKSTGGINSSYMETSATLTADGNTMYFVAEGEKGLGRGDIYMSTKQGSKWSLPVNLGDAINTVDDENTVWVSPDGNQLFFSSDGRVGLGGYDIYVSVKEDGKWTKPKNLGYPINSTDHDTHFRIYDQGRKATFSSVRMDGQGFQDLYTVDLQGWKIW